MSSIRTSVAFLAASVFVPQAALATSRVGNGGDAVVCREADNSIRSVELLDFYEARELRRGIVTALDLDAPTPAEKAARAFERIARFDPELAARFAVEARRFFDEASVKPIELVDLSDSRHLGYERGCKVEQLAIQREIGMPEDVRYLVDQTLFERLSSEGQAGLVVHEIVYGYALDQGQPDSVMTRYLTSMITSDKMASMTSEDWRSFVERTGFRAQHWYDFDRYWRVILLPERARTWREAKAACDAIENGKYQLPDIRQLLDVQPRLARSRLSGLILKDDIESSSDVLIWSTTSAGPSSACKDGEVAAKTLYFPADLQPAAVVPVCLTETHPVTLCLAEDQRDLPNQPQNDPAHGSVRQDDQPSDDPAQDVDPQQDDGKQGDDPKSNGGTSLDE